MYDLLIIGGGVNGCGIARDAAGRGLKVALVEKDDLAQATSSSSTKLFHGGLRYLEHYKFRLVRESLTEREVLLSAMPHISWPLRFVLPHHSGLRPAWFLRLGLFLYDHLGGRKILPGTKSIDFASDPVGKPLRDEFRRGFEYSDCWVEDSRLVVLNAVDAKNRGANIMTRTICEGATRSADSWKVNLRDVTTGDNKVLETKLLVNAAGPWVEDIIRNKAKLATTEKIRLVRGSHIVVKKCFEHDRAYIFQQSDGRIIFAIPYETDFTLIGTTEAEHDGDASTAKCSDDEAAYLCAAASEYFAKPVKVTDIVWSYSGVRPLYDDGASSATEATRDYVLKLNTGDNNLDEGRAPLLNIFGGKITTFRRLAEAALAKIEDHFPEMKAPWTASAPLPGGDFPVGDVKRLVADLSAAHPFLSDRDALRLIRAYGTDAAKMLAGANTREELGKDFGAGLSEREVTWLKNHEWAMTAEDIFWRRSKLGLQMTDDEIATLDAWMKSQAS